MNCNPVLILIWIELQEGVLFHNLNFIPQYSPQAFFMKQLRFTFLLLIIGVFTNQISAQEVVFEGLKEINGTHLFVKVIGEGEPVLIIHGGPGLNHNYFLPHLESLSKKYQLIFYDQRSAGQSELSVKAQMSVKQFTDDIEAIRKEFNIDKLNILCHSWSSILAANYIIAYPDHIKSVIFCNPTPLSRAYDIKMNNELKTRTQNADSIKRANIIASDAFQKGDMAMVNELMRLNFKSVFCDSANIDLFDAKLPADYLVASLSLQSLMYELKDLNLYDQLKAVNLQAPVYIIGGSCDIIPKEAFDQLIGCFPNAQYLQFENSGHYPFIEEKKLFTKRVGAFLKKVK